MAVRPRAVPTMSERLLALPPLGTMTVTMKPHVVAPLGLLVTLVLPLALMALVAHAAGSLVLTLFALSENATSEAPVAFARHMALFLPVVAIALPLKVTNVLVFPRAMLIPGSLLLEANATSFLPVSSFAPLLV